MSSEDCRKPICTNRCASDFSIGHGGLCRAIKHLTGYNNVL